LYSTPPTFAVPVAFGLVAFVRFSLRKRIPLFGYFWPSATDTLLLEVSPIFALEHLKHRIVIAAPD
jgi:hypothetical protein